MFSWFKRKKITLDCFTTSAVAYNLYRIDNSICYIPDWWKAIPTRKIKLYNNLPVDFSTIKRCQGIIDQYQRGIILPLWTDILIHTAQQSFSLQCADRFSEVEEHHIEQFLPAFTDYHHIKLLSPWRVREKTGLEFISMPCIWSLLNLTNHLHILTGHLNFKYQNGTHVNMFMDKSPERIFTLPAGTPLLQFIPLTQDDFILKHHHVTEIEFNRLFGLNNALPKFTGNYAERKKRLDQCPIKH